MLIRDLGCWKLASVGLESRTVTTYEPFDMPSIPVDPEHYQTLRYCAAEESDQESWKHVYAKCPQTNIVEQSGLWVLKIVECKLKQIPFPIPKGLPDIFSLEEV